MADISSQEQLEKIIKQQAEKAINEIKSQISDLLIKHIEKDVYTYDYYPNERYENGSGYPTGEFLKSWIWGDNHFIEDRVYSILSQDISVMRPPSLYHPATHGNYYRGQVQRDMRENLADVLNIYGYDVGGKKRNAFWDEFIKELDSKLDNWVKKAMKKYL